MTNTINYKPYAGKTLNELPAEILSAIILENSALRESISDMLYRWSETDVSEMLDCFRDLGRGIDYSLGTWGYNYITVHDGSYVDFLIDFINAGNDICLFSDKAIEQAKRLLPKARYYSDHAWEMSEKNEAALYEWLSDGIETLTDEMLRFCNNSYEYAMSDEAITETDNIYMWLENGYADDYRIDENGKVYKEIPACYIPASREYI